MARLIFDLDGVLTDTASVHAVAWKHTFDTFLKSRDGDDFTPFDIDHDYGEYVDGKPREDGVRDFLASRGITLPEGTDAAALLERSLAKVGVAFVPGAAFHPDGSGANTLRLSYSLPTTERIEEGIWRLAKVM